MRRTVIILSFTAALAGLVMAAAKPLQVKDLPQAVQKTVQEQAKGAEIKTISKETEKGVTQYEVETMVNGKHRDFNVDAKGGLIVVEQEVSIDSIPAAAKAGIMKVVGVGKLGMVEAATQGAVTFYEAGYASKDGKKHEVAVKADGTRKID
jgi:hypothetical protein